MSVCSFSGYLPIELQHLSSGWYSELQRKFKSDTSFRDFVVENENRFRELCLACMSFEALAQGSGSDHPIRSLVGRCVALEMKKTQSSECLLNCSGSIVSDSYIHSRDSFESRLSFLQSLVFDGIAKIFCVEDKRSWEELISLSPVEFIVKPVTVDCYALVSIDRYVSLYWTKNKFMPCNPLILNA
jgi:hypothetical protein